MIQFPFHHLSKSNSRANSSGTVEEKQFALDKGARGTLIEKVRRVPPSVTHILHLALRRARKMRHSTILQASSIVFTQKANPNIISRGMLFHMLEKVGGGKKKSF